MSRIRLFSLVLVLILALTPLAAFAQDDQKYEDYESEDGLLTLSAPEGWFSYVDDETPFPMVILINSEDGVARIEADEDPASGDKAILVFVLPSDFMGFLGLTLTEETTATETVEMVSAMFFEPEEDDGEDYVAEFGDAEEVELGDDLVAGVIPVADPTNEGVFMTFMPGDGLLVIAFSVAYPGEFTDEQAELGLTVAASVAYDGTGEDLLAAMMGAGASSDTPDGAVSESDGAALIEARCGSCHTTDRIYKADKDEAGWTATVDRMIGYGASLNDAEREAVLQYLVANQ